MLNISFNPRERHWGLYRLGHFLFRTYFFLYHRWKVEGRENIPLKGPVILASNHTSFLDPPVIGAAVNRPVWFIAKAELFHPTPLGWLLRKLGAYPVRRGEGDRAILRWALETLDAGEALVIFPEGTRSPDGRLQSPQPGIGLIALKSKAPVVPIGIIGSYEAMPVKAYFPKPKPLWVRIGLPLLFPDLYSDRITKERAEACARRIMQAIASLIQQTPTFPSEDVLSPPPSLNKALDESFQNSQ